MGKILQGTRLISADEMARIEALSVSNGACPDEYMREAGTRIGEYIFRYCVDLQIEKSVTVLTGGGNNGGDAYVVGLFLLNQGYDVEAFCLNKASSDLCKKYRDQFILAGGTVQDDLVLHPIVVDGVFGTGFKGDVDHECERVFAVVNQSDSIVFAIDIPSGVNGNTGESSHAICADVTFHLGVPKVGCFIGSGYAYTGESVCIDFGIEKQYLDHAKPSGFLINKNTIKTVLPVVNRDRHKYQAGYLLVVAGSKGLYGGAHLSCRSALRTGTGILRWYVHRDIHYPFPNVQDEIIVDTYEYENYQQVLLDQKRVHAYVVGPGIGRSTETGQFLKQLVDNISSPIVIDADALYHLQEFPKNAVLTPHYGEMKRLLKGKPVNHKQCQQFADDHQVIIVLKGSPTWVFYCHDEPLVINRGSPGMATAGSGDVLAGVIGSLLSQGVTPQKAAALGAFIHACAGEIAQKRMTAYSMIASDIINCLPDVFHDLMED